MSAWARAHAGRNVHVLLAGGTRTACGLDATTMHRWSGALCQGQDKKLRPICPACRLETAK
jgi:hypothetical protein